MSLFALVATLKPRLSSDAATEYLAASFGDSTDTTLLVWRLSDWELTYQVTDGIQCDVCDFKPGSSHLAYIHGEVPFKTLEIIDAATGTSIDSVNLPVSSGDMTCGKYSPDGTKFACTMDASPYIRVFNTSDWSLISVSGPGAAFGYAWSCDWSHDGNFLALAHWDSPYVSVYRTDTWTLLSAPSTLPNSQGTSVAFSNIASTPRLHVTSASSGEGTYYDIISNTISFVGTYNVGPPCWSNKMYHNDDYILMGTLYGEICRADPFELGYSAGIYYIGDSTFTNIDIDYTNTYAAVTGDSSNRIRILDLSPGPIVDITSSTIGNYNSSLVGPGNSVSFSNILE